MTHFGSPTILGNPASPTRQPRRVERPADEHCTGCGRASYTRGCDGARVNPLEDGRCPKCVAGWECLCCKTRYPLDRLSDELLCTRCWVAEMAKEAA